MTVAMSVVLWKKKKKNNKKKKRHRMKFQDVTLEQTDTWAYLRRDLWPDEFPPSDPQIPKEFWVYALFKVLRHPNEDFETEEGYNMIITHPDIEGPILVMSIDFDFCNNTEA
jgi:hypothetical protein